MAGDHDARRARQDTVAVWAAGGILAVTVVAHVAAYLTAGWSVPPAWSTLSTAAAVYLFGLPAIRKGQ